LLDVIPGREFVTRQDIPVQLGNLLSSFMLLRAAFLYTNVSKTELDSYNAWRTDVLFQKGVNFRVTSVSGFLILGYT
jgi:hypothetical protein